MDGRGASESTVLTVRRLYTPRSLGRITQEVQENHRKRTFHVFCLVVHS